MPLYGEAKRAYQRQWMHARRQAWIDSKGGCCKQCGSTESLEVDHIEPSMKTMQPREIWSRTESAVASELANCQVLCADCHAKKTYAPRPLVHGTYYGYRRYKCRCSDCRGANAATRRAERASIRSAHTLAA